MKNKTKFFCRTSGCKGSRTILNFLKEEKINFDKIILDDKSKKFLKENKKGKKIPLNNSEINELKLNFFDMLEQSEEGVEVFLRKKGKKANEIKEDIEKMSMKEFVDFVFSEQDNTYPNVDLIKSPILFEKKGELIKVCSTSAEDEIRAFIPRIQKISMFKNNLRKLELEIC